MTQSEEQYPFDALSFDDERCFLCGDTLGGDNTTEHVFPKWLMQRYGLWDKKLWLLNGSSIPYRRLTIPCCRSCNTNHLSRLEKEIKKAHDRGYHYFEALPETRLYQWVAKIFFGILRKETTLLLDRSEPDHGKAVVPDFLDGLRFLHVLLQSIRIDYRFTSPYPFVVWVFKTHCYGDDRDFDYADNLTGLTSCIRVGEIGVLTTLQDNGDVRTAFGHHKQRLGDIDLHPVPLAELFAALEYLCSRRQYVPKFLSGVSPGECQAGQVITMVAGRLSNLPPFTEGSPGGYAKFLVRQLRRHGYQFDDVFQQPDKVLTTIEREDGSLNKLDRDGNCL